MATATSERTLHHPAATTSDWHRLLRVSAAVTLGLSVMLQIVGQFFGISLALLGALLAIGLLIDATTARAGLWWLLVAGVLFLGTHVPILTSVLRYPEDAGNFVIVLGLIVGLAGIVTSSIRTIREHRHPSRRERSVPLALGLTALALWTAASGYSVVQRMQVHDAIAARGEAVIDLKDGRSTAPTIVLEPGQTSIMVHNIDDSSLFLKSTDAHIDVFIPAGYHRRSHIDVGPGTYRYTLDGPDLRANGSIIASE